MIPVPIVIGPIPGRDQAPENQSSYDWGQDVGIASRIAVNGDPILLRSWLTSARAPMGIGCRGSKTEGHADRSRVASIGLSYVNRNDPLRRE